MADAGVFALIVPALAAIGAGKRYCCRSRPIEHEHLRGRSLRSPAQIKESLSRLRKDQASALLIGRHAFPPHVASRHVAFIGTTGSGKTLLQRSLMQSAFSEFGRGRSHRALVYDAKQDQVSLLRGMRLKCPIHLFNPFDERSAAWNMAADITNPVTALQVASSLIPESKSDANPFFSNAARHLLYGTLLALIELAPKKWTLRHALLLLRDMQRLRRLLSNFESTKHLSCYFTHPATAQNIFSTLLSHTGPYEIIAACWDRAEHSLSLAKWVSEESVLVLGNDEQNRTALDTINRLLFRRVSELVLAGTEVDERTWARRTWFFLDEVREAGKLELLGRLLNKGRSKGVAVVLGFQDISGMWEAYGREAANELLGQCNTKIILRLNSPETAAWAAKLFGNREVLEKRRSSSRSRRMGLNGDASIGASVSHGISQLPVVLDSEILDLPEPTRETGITALFTSPVTGPFLDHIPGDWLAKALSPHDPGIPNFVPRPDSDQYLRPWDAGDDALLKFEFDDYDASHSEAWTL